MQADHKPETPVDSRRFRHHKKAETFENPAFFYLFGPINGQSIVISLYPKGKRSKPWCPHQDCNSIVPRTD